MKYIESPEIYEPADDVSIFLAGGITGCPNWQREVAVILESTNLTLLNPRRKNFPIDDPGAALDQITWEFQHLRQADAILFWFPRETLCPIVLYELGAWSMRHIKPIFVGVHPDYKRKPDVEIQTRLVRPYIKIVYSLADLVHQVMVWSG